MAASISDPINSFYDYLKYLNLQLLTHLMDVTWLALIDPQLSGTKNILDPPDSPGLLIVRQPDLWAVGCGTTELLLILL